jgi:site-specific DNA recombinase
MRIYDKNKCYLSFEERVHYSRRGWSMKKPPTTTRRNGTVRCAIYTRKSSEEGLEQEFNSLQAQREACEAFINSQRHEGWVCLPAGYDDGGFSGATMARPALQQLLADVTAGRVDTVVVYKIDRLTRALADFAKIVEILDAKGASFVAVTHCWRHGDIGRHDPAVRARVRPYWS